MPEPPATLKLISYAIDCTIFATETDIYKLKDDMNP